MAAVVEAPVLSPIEESGVAKELRKIEEYKELNKNQKRLLCAIVEFSSSIKFGIWDDTNHSSRVLRAIPIMIELMDSSDKQLIFLKNLAKIDDQTSINYINDTTDSPNRVCFSLIACLLFHIKLLKKGSKNRVFDFINSRAFDTCNILMDFVQHRASEISPLFSSKILFLISHVFDLLNRPNALIKYWFQMLNVFDRLHHEESYATLVNLIVRSYIRDSLWLQADNFIKKSHFSENVSNFHQARYSFYCGNHIISSGLIRLIYCEYQAAFSFFSRALTSSQNLKAVGLRQSAVRCMLMSKLLIGKFPDRKLFQNECFFKGILPYFDLIKAVKHGSSRLFTEYLEKNIECYRRDRTTAIVFRLHHNVLKAALVKLGLSYSSISLADVAKRLQLDVCDVEFVVAKAIKDGIISAVIDHENAVVNFKSSEDICNTHKPQKLAEQRSTICNRLCSKFITTMTYPKSAYTFETKADDYIDEVSDIDDVLHVDDDVLF